MLFSERFTRSFRQAPDRVQREFGKQLGYLLRDLRPFPSVQEVRQNGRYLAGSRGPKLVILCAECSAK